MVKALKRTGIFLSSSIAAWLLYSYLEIVIKCLDNPVYSKFNIFVLVFKNLDELLKGGIF